MTPPFAIRTKIPRIRSSVGLFTQQCGGGGGIAFSHYKPRELDAPVGAERGIDWGELFSLTKSGKKSP
jgi:hypothetical protein